MSNVLLREEKDGVVLVTLNRPEVLNALNNELRIALSNFWVEFRDDPKLKVAVITGAGDRAFSTGRDLKETAQANQDGKKLSFEATGEYGYPSNLQIGKPVIAAIHGHCLAAGLMIAIGCDIRISSDGALFGNPQVKRGRGTMMPYRLVQAGLPRAVVMDMVLTGKSINAQEAYRWGLVSRVTAMEELIPAALSIANEIANNSLVVVSGIKRAAELGLLDLPSNEALKLWPSVTQMMHDTADAREGALSFSENRKSKFE